MHPLEDDDVVVHVEALLRNPPEAPRSLGEGTLWLREHKLDDRCASALALALRRGDHTHLRCVSLAANEISARGMAAIAGAIAQDTLPLLELLSLDSNFIGDDGMKALCRAFNHVPKLKAIECQRCGVGAEGWKAFTAAATGGALQSLESLYASENSLGDEGIKGFCDTLGAGGLPRLSNAHFRQCEIGDEGCLALADAIEAGHLDHVRQVQMALNTQTRDGFEVVTDVIKEYDKQRKLQVIF